MTTDDVQAARLLMAHGLTAREARNAIRMARMPAPVFRTVMERAYTIEEGLEYAERRARLRVVESFVAEK